MRILFVGDIVGKPGRRIVRERLQGIVDEKEIHLAIVNCENAAAGYGITAKLADELFAAGADVLTSGNHIWDKKEVLTYLPDHPRLLRPANYPDPLPGSGLFVGNTAHGVPYAVLNLQGRTYLPAIDSPFHKVDELLNSLDQAVKIRFIDFHAEVTSEKIAFGWYVDGRVSAMIGTHTHVPTADERVLPGGTAYLTDAGMTGPYDSVIGMDKETSIRRFLEAVPLRFEPARNDVRLSAAIVEVDESSGKASSIERLMIYADT